MSFRWGDAYFTHIETRRNLTGGPDLRFSDGSGETRPPINLYCHDEATWGYSILFVSRRVTR